MLTVFLLIICCRILDDGTPLFVKTSATWFSLGNQVILCISLLAIISRNMAISILLSTLFLACHVSLPMS